MDIVTLAAIIVGVTVGGVVRYGIRGDNDVRGSLAWSVGLGIALLIVAIGPAVIGSR